MKRIIFLLLGIFFLSSSAVAQIAISGFPFAFGTYNQHSLALGNAVVSLDGNYADQHINPAGIGVPGTLQLSSNWDTYYQPLRVAFKQKRFTGSYQFENSALAFSFQHFETGEQITTVGKWYPTSFKFNNRDYIVSGTYSYNFANGINVGAALNYLHSGQGTGSSNYSRFGKEDNTWSVDVGAQYHFPHIKVQYGTILPHVGLALNDFGSSAYYYDGDSKDPIPTALRAGGGVRFLSRYKIFGQPLLDILLLQNVSKIMVRIEERFFEDRYYYDPMNPFKALTHSWDSYEYFDGDNFHSIKLANQLWWHSGIEMKFLNTIAFRWGRQTASKAEKELSYNAFGFGIDLQYVAIDLTNINNDEYGNYLDGNNSQTDFHWQITGRIPLDGNRPDTILNHFFN